ncbi:hypothetical protein [Marinivivus vitaminiproducens]|uniref:hypothetical protein n=1 Tax=Marinivivus vitaminiproducens TaxID=3035935 RepID=UPI002799DFCC|nr:hypothetical protein P4R82_24970 [Geminicoccaceae bacterium SCSIO 64248]
MSLNLPMTFAQRFRAGFATILTPNPFRRPVWSEDRIAIERALHAWEMTEQLDLTMDAHWDRYRAVREALYDEAADATVRGTRLFPASDVPTAPDVPSPEPTTVVAWANTETGACAVETFARAEPYGSELPDEAADDEAVLIDGTWITAAEHRMRTARAAPIARDRDTPS